MFLRKLRLLSIQFDTHHLHMLNFNAQHTLPPSPHNCLCTGPPPSTASPTLYVQTLFMHLNFTLNPILLLRELRHNWTALVTSIFIQNPVICSGSPPLAFALSWLSNHRIDISPSSFPAVNRLGSHKLPHTQDYAHFGKCLKLRLSHGFSPWSTFNNTCGLRFASYVQLNFSLPVISRPHLIAPFGVTLTQADVLTSTPLECFAVAHRKQML